MRLIFFDLEGEGRRHFYPVALSRPIWELRCGMTSLGEKLVAKTGISDVACFVPEYMAAACRSRKPDRKVNDPGVLKGDDLLLVNPRVKAATFSVPTKGPSEVGLAEDGQVLYARVAKTDAGKLKADSIAGFLDSAKASLKTVAANLPTWDYVWDLVLASPHQITDDFKAAGQTGIEGTVEQPSAIRGNKSDIYIAKGALVHPMVVLDAANGPIYIDENAEIHPFSRIEGPCYIGPKCLLLGAKCREGNSFGPVCRIGGEVEESIVQGYSNKYHDGFLGHAYVGEWVNLGALTTNSDLKNDYSNVSVMLDGKNAIDTGSTKVGSLIGDHTKTSIGTLFNTGAYVGCMSLIMATGKPLPKFIPSFAWFLEGVVTKGFGKKQLYETAKIAMSRRKMVFDEAQQSLYDRIFELTKPERDEAVKKGRKQMVSK
jgi:UDP-N-acetylglucosamine diphosphorylase/glucosamine-1-phosphate N-acetyltransferase